MAWIFVFSPNIGWGNAAAQIRVRLRRGAGEHLFDGGDDLGAVEPLFPARLSGAGAGAARARRAHGGGRADVGRESRAGLHPGHVAAVAAGDPVRLAAPVRDGDGLLRGAAPHRPAGAHRRVHHRHPGRRHLDAAGLRGRERARPDAARDLHRRGVLLSPRHPARGILRHYHRQGLPADARQARALALAGRARHRRDVRARARLAAGHAGLAVVLPQSGAAVLVLGAHGRRSTTTTSSCAIRSSSRR